MRLPELYTALIGSFRSVDVRLAACKNLPIRLLNAPDRRLAEWESLRSVIRLSSRTLETVQRRHGELTRALGRHSSERFKLVLAALPVTALPDLTTGHTIVPRLEGEEIVLESLPTEVGVTAMIRRARQFVSPWPGTPVRSAAEYVYAPSADTSGTYEYFAAVDREVTRTTGRARNDLMRSYLELIPGGQDGVALVYVEVEMPGCIQSAEIVDRGLEISIEYGAPPENLRAVAARRHMATYSVIEQHDMAIGPEPTGDGATVLRARTEFAGLNERDRVECRLVDSRVGDIDELVDEAKAFMPFVEQNPLLVCLRRFWDLDEQIYGPVERPAGTKARAGHVFQAGIAKLLTVCGFQAVDLRDEDTLRPAGSKVVVGTADILAYSRPHRAVLVGACVIGVPKDEDYQKVIDAREVLRRELPAGSRIALVPVLFSSQESEPVFQETLDRRGIRLVTHGELVRFREWVESGREDGVVESLLGR